MKKESRKLSKEELESISMLGDELRVIHIRLIKEGKIKVQNGKVIWIESQSS